MKKAVAILSMFFAFLFLFNVDIYNGKNSQRILIAHGMTSNEVITLGSSVNDCFTSNEIKKEYKFTIKTSGRCEFKLVSTDFNHCWIDICNLDDGIEWQGGSGIKVGTARSADLTSGTYYLVVQSSGGLGTYTLKTNFIPSDETFSGDNGAIDKANTIIMGNTIYGQLADNRKADFYKFNLATSGRLNFKLVSTELDHCWIDIYDTDYGMAWEGGSGIKVGNTREVDLAKGTYYLRILSSGGTGAYTLKAKYTPSGEKYIGDNGKINLSNVVNANSVIKGQLANNRKADYYNFTLSSKGTIKFKLSSTELRHCWIDIYDTDYGMVWEGGSGIRVGEERSATLNKGKYILRILSSGETGAYTLKMGTNATTIVKKKTPTIRVSKKTAAYWATRVRWASQSFRIGAKVSGNGKITYKKLSGSSKLVVASNGKVTVRRGTRKGTYRAIVQIRAAESSKYKARTVKITVTVRVK